MKRSVFFVSDRTGISAETLGRTLLTQFPTLEFTFNTLPFTDSPAKARQVALKADEAAVRDGVRPLIFSTMVDPALRALIADANAHIVELFSAFIEPLERVLSAKSTQAMGRMHGIGDLAGYQRRIDAVNFTLAHDDGIKVNDLNGADLVLLGVSRSGKTPTCLYLAMQFYVKAANYPLTEDDLQHHRLPRCLEPCRDKLFGLSIDPDQLKRIRAQRRPESRYASLAQCRDEVHRAEALYRREGIPFLHTTSISVEEIAMTVAHASGLR